MTAHSHIRCNVAAVRQRIAAAAERSGRTPDAVRLVAVTKTATPDEARAVFDAGVHDLGENRWPDAAQRVSALPGASWHFIGRLQKNKINKILPVFSWIHSIDGLPLLKAVSSRAPESPPSVLLEVNVSGESSKQGLPPDDVLDVLRSASSLPGVAVVGLMTMAPYVAPELTRPVFRGLHALMDDLNSRSAYRIPLEHLSMGMSNDFEVAVEEGSTIVRIGTALFDPQTAIAQGVSNAP
ncbi:MAG: YggS family pyridoxal phosphate-dependent enzyme [Planctomycetes bacterium]|nr:YggS family pyridoxal phosphate-dependent enzyme [Planctomycetota bacterium]